MHLAPAHADIWSQALGQLRTTTKRSVVDSWFDKIKLDAHTDDAVRLGVPDSHFRDYIALHHLDDIRRTLEELAARPLAVELVVARDVRGSAAVPPVQQALDLAAVPLAPPDFDDVVAQAQAVGQGSSPGTDLLARLTFDAFVEGESNRHARNAALAVAQAPGTLYNPLFLFGGVGVGKTHLLQAIGHAVRRQHPQLRVRYVAAEAYIDDTIAAMRAKDGAVRIDVRGHYRNCDVLLVDDIQFLQGKEKTQDEFFHLLNALHMAGKQVVLSCDRYPSELQHFHDRLRSRFDQGLVVPMTAPDRDLRVAILRRKAAETGVELPYEVLAYLAEHLRNNVRELEGALNKLVAYSRIGKCAIDLHLARTILGPMIELPSRNLTAETIQRTTAQHFNLKVTDLKGSKRHKSVVVPRMIAMFLTRKHTALSFPEIGRVFGGRDHSTAIHACQKIEWQQHTDPAVQAALQAIETALGR